MNCEFDVEERQALVSSYRYRPLKKMFWKKIQKTKIHHTTKKNTPHKKNRPPKKTKNDIALQPQNCHGNIHFAAHLSHTPRGRGSILAPTDNSKGRGDVKRCKRCNILRHFWKLFLYKCQSIFYLLHLIYLFTFIISTTNTFQKYHNILHRLHLFFSSFLFSSFLFYSI
jgi:hypothetical protein